MYRLVTRRSCFALERLAPRDSFLLGFRLSYLTAVEVHVTRNLYVYIDGGPICIIYDTGPIFGGDQNYRDRSLQTKFGKQLFSENGW